MRLKRPSRSHRSPTPPLMSTNATCRPSQSTCSISSALARCVGLAGRSRTSNPDPAPHPPPSTLHRVSEPGPCVACLVAQAVLRALRCQYSQRARCQRYGRTERALYACIAEQHQCVPFNALGCARHLFVLHEELLRRTLLPRFLLAECAPRFIQSSGTGSAH